MPTQPCSWIPQEGLGFLRVSQICCLTPTAATLLPSDRPVWATWGLEMVRNEQELAGIGGAPRRAVQGYQTPQRNLQPGPEPNPPYTMEAAGSRSRADRAALMAVLWQSSPRSEPTLFSQQVQENKVGIERFS
jgi:hypothetical protein